LEPFCRAANWELKSEVAVGAFKCDFLVGNKVAIECNEKDHAQPPEKDLLKQQNNWKLLNFNPDDKNFCFYTLLGEIVALMSQ